MSAVLGKIIYPLRSSQRPAADLCIVFGDQDAKHEIIVNDVRFAKVQDAISGAVQASVRGKKATIKFKKANMAVWFRKRGQTVYIEEVSKEDYLFVIDYFERFHRDGKLHASLLTTIKNWFLGK